MGDKRVLRGTNPLLSFDMTLTENKTKKKTIRVNTQKPPNKNYGRGKFIDGQVVS
jgi:hypothetical protein